MSWEEHLRDLSVAELLDLQMAVTRTLQKILAGAQEVGNSRPQQVSGDTGVRDPHERFSSPMGRGAGFNSQAVVVKTEYKDADSVATLDSEEFIPTQWEKTDTKPQDASSPPLKMPDAKVFAAVAAAGFGVELVDDQKIDQIELEPHKKVDFNSNPLTLKPWILEDFKPNRDLPNVKRGRKRLQNFQEEIERGLKTENGNESTKEASPQQHGSNRNVWTHPNRHLQEFPERMIPQFDNLRDRSTSPPGFGRMDFPTTQERQWDKQRSQQIIYEKTLYRLQCATNNKIPPYEREFLFKKPSLNELVDFGAFVWSQDKVQIFKR